MTATQLDSKTRSDIFSDPSLFRLVGGALQYVTLTRPDINYAINKVCQFMSNLLETHWTTVKKILQYLKDTILYGLRMQPTYASRPFYYCPL